METDIKNKGRIENCKNTGLSLVICGENMVSFRQQ